MKYSLSFRAALTKTSLRPFVGAGISPSLLLLQENHYLIDYGVTQQRQPLLTNVKSFEFGYFGSVGVMYNRFTGEVRVEMSNGLRPAGLSSPVNTIYILLSYRLLEGEQ